MFSWGIVVWHVSILFSKFLARPPWPPLTTLTTLTWLTRLDQPDQSDQPTSSALPDKADYWIKLEKCSATTKLNKFLFPFTIFYQIIFNQFLPNYFLLGQALVKPSFTCFPTEGFLLTGLCNLCSWSTRLKSKIPKNCPHFKSNQLFAQVMSTRKSTFFFDG